MKGGVPALSRVLCREVLLRLDCAGILVDLAGLTAVYRAWAAQLGMENVSKRLRLLSGLGVRVLPEEFFEGFLRHGTGGTCWNSMVAFVALLRGIGFDARPRLGEMTAEGTLNHGATVVILDGRHFSVDQNLLWPAPLPLDRERPTLVRGPLASASARFDRRRAVFVIERISPESPPLRTVLHTREITAEDYLPPWLRSAESSRFNSGCFIHRAREDWRGLLDGDVLREVRLPDGSPTETRVRREEWPQLAERLFSLDGKEVARMIALEDGAR